MLTIHDYIDTARKRHGLASDRALSRMLGFRGQGVCHWRTGRAYPNEENIVELARLAGLDERRAILDLLSWKVTGRAREIVDRMALDIGRLTVFLACFIGLEQVMHRVTLAFPGCILWKIRGIPLRSCS